MTLTGYRSGLIVSPLALGTMTFGMGRWGTDEAASRAIFDRHLDVGGKFIADSGSRDSVVLSTKFAVSTLVYCH